MGVLEARSKQQSEEITCSRLVCQEVRSDVKY